MQCSAYFSLPNILNIPYADFIISISGAVKSPMEILPIRLRLVVFKLQSH